MSPFLMRLTENARHRALTVIVPVVALLCLACAAQPAVRQPVTPSASSSASAGAPRSSKAGASAPASAQPSVAAAMAAAYATASAAAVAAKAPDPAPRGKPGGRIAPEIVQQIIRANFGRFRHCYERALRPCPNLRGRVSVRFVIDVDGSVKRPRSFGSDLPDSSVSACVAESFRELRFPKPEGGTVTVTYPIVFSPGG